MSCRPDAMLILLVLSMLAMAMLTAPADAFLSHPIPVSTTMKTTTTTTTTTNPVRPCDMKLLGLLDGVQEFMKRFTTKATASHILIKGGAEAENKLEDIKLEIDNSPVKFAEAAARYSQCPSASSGGSLGEFGPGQMVKEFDQVVFNDDVGVVHGPVKTQFGYHLIYISDRRE